MKDRLRAPAEHGAVLFDPPPNQTGELLEQAQSFDLPNARFCDLSFRDWRELARHEANSTANGPWILAGHQPELFHPGVWVKNFVISAIANRHHGTSLNLIVDNDVVKSRSIRVPNWTGRSTSPDALRTIPVSFDTSSEQVPFEDATVHHERVFHDFARQVSELAQSWPEKPFVSRFWDQVDQSQNLGVRFANARRTFETEWGAANNERTISELCRTSSFAGFAGALILDLPRFHDVYNRCLHEYRRHDGIRSAEHPVPDLIANGEWFEAPFWVWTNKQNRRRKLFVRRRADQLYLAADQTELHRLPIRRLADSWGELETIGIKVRTRALTTTMFARLALADIFIHGIGGGLYDRLTDEISRQYFGSAPPPFMVVTGTMRLPLAIEQPGTTAISSRDLTWNPQRHLSGNGEIGNLVSERKRLIAAHPDERQGRRARYHALRENLERLTPFMADELAATKAAETDASARARANAILSSRDYSFVLHSERELRQFFQRAMGQITS